MPEARLAREAELCYATLAMVTDYDVWHESEADVSVEVVLSNLDANSRAASAIVRVLADEAYPSGPARAGRRSIMRSSPGPRMCPPRRGGGSRSWLGIDLQTHDRPVGVARRFSHLPSLTLAVGVAG